MLLVKLLKKQWLMALHLEKLLALQWTLQMETMALQWTLQMETMESKEVKTTTKTVKVKAAKVMA